ncbi:hydantoinase B/oxoprolinase family protein [Burkholderia ambifaria]|uniref:hydantoinase B/oxoprolinase family protein n=1 Tax=Burkholderia ambifaria TaxID=152480 RepID=UPI001F16F7BE|nr:hydantoinase B/oxoprolinase family protein [Burkholderia ambifaria]
MAAVLYVFRTLVGDDIPLNAGCLKPLTVIVPARSMLNPEYRRRSCRQRRDVVGGYQRAVRRARLRRVEPGDDE